MAFSDHDLDSLSDDFIARAEAQIVAPRAWERSTGANAGFSHFQRATGCEEQPTKPAPRKCARCRQLADGTGRLCLRHKEQHRQQVTALNRRRGRREWRPGWPGRTPNVVRSAVAAEVSLQAALLNDALCERAALNRRIARLRAELTLALKLARLKLSEVA